MVCDLTNSLDPGPLFSINRFDVDALQCTKTEDGLEVGVLSCSEVNLELELNY